MACSWAPRADRAIGGRTEGDPRLGGERIGFGPVGRVRVGREVVAGEGAGELVGAERSRRTAPRRGGGPFGPAARACCRRPRGSAPGRTRTGRAPGDARVGLERRGARAGRGARRRGSRSAAVTPETAASPASVKLWPSTAASDDERPVVGLEAVEPGRDERGQRLGHGQARQVADRPVDAVVERRAGPRRGASGPSRRRRAGCRRRGRRSPATAGSGRPGHEPGEELAHRRRRRAARGRAR